MANPRTKARLEARIQERAAYCLQFEIRDPRASFVTITRVELSPDLTSGRIHYSVLGGQPERSKAEHMLRSAAGFIQRQVARVLTLRRMPHLRWVYDDSLEVADNMDRLIREARERDRAISGVVEDDAGGDVQDDEDDEVGEDGELDEENAEDDEAGGLDEQDAGDDDRSSSARAEGW
jgi:ribosome-binding factor A